MSEETANVEATAPVEGAQDVTVDSETPAEGAKTFDETYVKELRQEAAKYRTQNKELAEKAKAYDEYVQSQKSEQEKQAEALAAATKERDALRAEMLRMKIASEKNLPASLVDRLRGETEDEMKADADSLLEGLKSSFVEKKTTSPKDTGAGVVGESKANSVDDFIEMMRKRS